MSHYWAGDNAWTNPQSQALPWRREGSSGAIDVTNQSWPYLTALVTLDGFLDPSPVQADLPTSAKAQVEAELKQATAEANSNSSGRVPARRPAKGEKAETNTQGKASAVRRSSSRVASRDVEVEREDIQEDEHEGMQGAKEDEVLQLGKETSGQRHLRSRRAKSPSPALHTSPSDAVPSNAKRKLTSAVGPTPKPKRRKAGDPLAGWAIELVPGDKTTAVTPREYAEKEPEEFAAQYPQYIKFL
ncbi:hypothetical protein B0H13DRAFT_2328505 [Mycena leptocephala]|nr:hypothetical protein B0H13DRAFT_2328505 [Mycena leptocephala]